MKYRFEEQDPVTGLITRWYADENGKVGVQRVNPAIHDILDHNKAVQNATLNDRWGDGKIFASVPLEVVEKELWQAIKNKDQAYLKKWFNNADHKNFRRKAGNI